MQSCTCIPTHAFPSNRDGFEDRLRRSHAASRKRRVWHAANRFRRDDVPSRRPTGSVLLWRLGERLFQSVTTTPAVRPARPATSATTRSRHLKNTSESAQGGTHVGDRQSIKRQTTKCKKIGKYINTRKKNSFLLNALQKVFVSFCVGFSKQKQKLKNPTYLCPKNAHCCPSPLVT